MADPLDTPRSKLDFLYRDVLGEVARLVERLETVSGELREATKALEGTAEAGTRWAGGGAAKVRAELERSAEMACRRLAAVHETATASPKARWRDGLVWGGICLGASMLGGAVVALMLRTS